MIKAAFDPVTLATPFFVLTVLLEIVLARFRVAKANYETRDTATSLLMGLGFDRTGSYTIPLQAFLGAICVAIFLFGRLGPYRYGVREPVDADPGLRASAAAS